MADRDFDILIAGGGIAGLITTLVLAQSGFSTLCIDPVIPVTDRSNPQADLRSTAFLQPAIQLLREAEIWPDLEPHAAPLRVMRIADAGGKTPEIRARSDFVADEVGCDVFGYNILNWVLRSALIRRIEALDHAHLRTGIGLAGFTSRLDETIVRLSDGSRIRARLVIGADGRGSRVRELCGIACKSWSYGQKALVFTIHHSQPHQDISTEIHRTGGPCTFVPLLSDETGERSAVVWMNDGPECRRLSQLDTSDFEAALALRSCGILGDIKLASRRMMWPIISQLADRLDGPRVALIAEAAHVVPPIGAQGLNMSLRDLASLRDLCADTRRQGGDIGAPDLLRHYHRARHGDIVARVMGVDALNRASMADAQPLRDLRLLGLRTISGLKPLKHKVMTLGLGTKAATETQPKAAHPTA